MIEAALDLTERLPQAAEQASVAILVVTHNSFDDFKRLHASLLNLDNQDFDLFVVDSGSRNLERLELRKLASLHNFKIFIAPGNIGFAGSNNIGLRYIKASNYQYVWLLNPDTTISNSSLTEHLKLTESEKDVSAWGSNIVSEDGSTWSLGGFVDKSKQQVGMHETANPENNIDYLPGCSIFFRAEVLEQVGFLPEHYFMYFEETSWCQKMLSKGLKLSISPESEVVHYFNTSKSNTARHTYLYNKASFLFWYEQKGIFGKLGYLAKTIFSRLPKTAYAYLRAPNREYKLLFLAHLKAQKDFLKHCFFK